MVKGWARGHTAFSEESEALCKLKAQALSTLLLWLGRPHLSKSGDPFPGSSQLPILRARRSPGLHHTTVYLFMGLEGYWPFMVSQEQAIRGTVRELPGQVTKCTESAPRGQDGRSHLLSARNHCALCACYAKPAYRSCNGISQLAPPDPWLRKDGGTANHKCGDWMMGREVIFVSFFIGFCT